ncbi:type I restriction-modification system,DNA-methyltransferase subunit M (plasmid) [Helicobacter bizzozeronii CIII-1]|uniref:site-specific DNA-methyltransferase (adenine-specific) n=1 Tax=Helicobacter bizzozeronii (strain CIII-1) TaxID=1002804 RepID=F8KUI3_HELBC|nr:type I restriction-modification system subunit M [Helicobacter bizzozeronii]CCB80918.1 type I restriction-modification system,DNA-methyltransferase subunit M [Helicobacter bizzozeronii CIII-1]
MNKQELASAIWDSCNKMRGKIEANEYKDILLGFIFYKYLCDRLLEEAKKAGISPENRKEALCLDDKNPNYGRLQFKLGYFITHDHLFDTLLEKGSTLQIQDIANALTDFDNHVKSKTEDEDKPKDNDKPLLKSIFNDLRKSLDKLGDPKAQANHVKDLLQNIDKIPSQSKTYDVLGFVYEFLIAQFASSAGKKAGEFYTPAEVSVLMSEIIASFFKGKNKQEITLYDSACGSGSLLLHMRHILAEKYALIDTNGLKYKAQELVTSTCNLTKMNLIMRGINARNIDVRNADTLKEDWPRGEDNQALRVDVCVSNPPYSAHWENTACTSDPRYKEFGIAPQTKADFAFLLHDLYHLKPDGIMAIVLPHGVLFRGNEEGKIRQALLEKGKIDAIIGLPPNLFFGTGIPTIIMVLKHTREGRDVFIIDASDECVKEGNKNALQARHIRKIADTLEKRQDVPHFARKVPLEEIKANNYVLNIPSYISAKEEEKDDLNALILGGIPKIEIAQIQELEDFNATHKLFSPIPNREGYYQAIEGDPLEILNTHAPIKAFKQNFKTHFANFKDLCKQKFLSSVENLQTCPVLVAMENLRIDLLQRFTTLKYLDKYEALQILEDLGGVCLTDMETIQLEGLDTITQTQPIGGGGGWNSPS